jgi:phage terminase large subunit-like protein
MILERLKERLTFSKLLDDALDSYKEYQPDRIIIEKAASGVPLIQEMRRRGIPASPVPPKGSKIARANAASVAKKRRFNGSFIRVSSGG